MFVRYTLENGYTGCTTKMIFGISKRSKPKVISTDGYRILHVDKSLNDGKGSVLHSTDQRGSRKDILFKRFEKMAWACIYVCKEEGRRILVVNPKNSNDDWRFDGTGLE